MLIRLSSVLGRPLYDGLDRHALFDQGLAERGERACSARLDGAEGDVLARGDLGVAEAFEERDLERLTLRLGEACERSPDLLALGGVGREPLRIAHRRRRLVGQALTGE